MKETHLHYRRIPNNMYRYTSLEKVEINCLLESKLDMVTYFHRIEKPFKHHFKQEMKVNTTTSIIQLLYTLLYCVIRPIHFCSIFPKPITSVVL